MTDPRKEASKIIGLPERYVPVVSVADETIIHPDGTKEASSIYQLGDGREVRTSRLSNLFYKDAVQKKNP